MLAWGKVWEPLTRFSNSNNKQQQKSMKINVFTFTDTLAQMHNNTFVQLNFHHWILFCMHYCIRGNFRGGFIFVNFASQTRANISTSIHVYYCNENIRKSRNYALANFPTKSKITKISVREIYGVLLQCWVRLR